MTTSDGPTSVSTAAMAQGWTYALNTVARPAAEHLEAAQAALTALERLDNARAWSDTATALSEALVAARARLAPHSPTIVELVAAVKELRALGLMLAVDGPPAGADQGIPTVPLEEHQAIVDRATARVAELEAELEAANADYDGQGAELRRVGQLRDRFEQEARDLRSRSTVTQAGIRAQAEVARAGAQRREHLAVLAMLGTSGPGFDQMPDDELAETVGGAVRRAARESAAVPRMVTELGKAWRRLTDVQNGAPMLQPDDPEALAQAVRVEAFRVCTTLGGVRDALGDQRREITELRAAQEENGAVALRAERDSLMRSRDAQAAELRALRAQVVALGGIPGDDGTGQD